MNERENSGQRKPHCGSRVTAAALEEHVRHEFATHNTQDTLDTMVEDAYVNHIPVLTEGLAETSCGSFTPSVSFPDATRHRDDCDFADHRQRSVGGAR